MITIITKNHLNFAIIAEITILINTAWKYWSFLVPNFYREIIQDGAQWQEEKLSVSELKKSQDIDKMLVQVEKLVKYFLLNKLSVIERKMYCRS